MWNLCKKCGKEQSFKKTCGCGISLVKTSVALCIFAIVIFLGIWLYMSKNLIVVSPGIDKLVNPASVINASSIVSIQGMRFEPAVAIVAKGESVIWKNNDPVPHKIVPDVSGVPDFTSPELNNSKEFTFKFDTVGTFDYHCAIHPVMKGMIIVREL